MLHFTMPGLSKYVFYYNGEVKNVRTGEYLKMKNIVNGRQQYDVYLDEDVKRRTTITIQEIIAYGKHVKFIREERFINMEMRLPSKINIW